MSEIQRRAPSNSHSSIRGSGSNSGEDSEDFIRQVNNSLKLSKILQETYNIKLVKQYNSNWSESIVCPFPFHKGGNERTGSFGYNFKSDYFHCFGCGASGRSVEFIAFINETDKYLVAQELSEDIDLSQVENTYEPPNRQEIQELLFKFSAKLNKLYSTKDPEVIEELDKIVWWIDLFIYTRISSKKELKVEEVRNRINRAEELLDEL